MYTRNRSNHRRNFRIPLVARRATGQQLIRVPLANDVGSDVPHLLVLRPPDGVLIKILHTFPDAQCNAVERSAPAAGYPARGRASPVGVPLPSNARSGNRTGQGSAGRRRHHGSFVVVAGKRHDRFRGVKPQRRVFLLLLRLCIEKVVHHRDDDGHALHQRDVCCVGQYGQSRC